VTDSATFTTPEEATGTCSITTVCTNCDTSIQYVQEHYFHYDAKRATGALSTGRKRAPKVALSTDWMREPYLKEN
jgi:hypothetical protein